MMQFIIDRFTYHPERAVPVPMESFDHQQTYISGSQGDIHLRYKINPSSSKFILFSHGNSSCVESIAPTYRLYEELGVSYLAYDYPGYGKSAGKPNEKGLYESFNLALDFVLKDIGILPTDLYLHGLSLGGAVTINSIGKRPSAGLILEATFTSARDMAKVIFPNVPGIGLIVNGYNSIDKIGEVSADILFIHGANDPTIPVSHSYELAKSSNVPHHVYVIPNCGHRDHKEVGGVNYFEVWRKFLDGGVPAFSS